ncbi:MAG: NOL1/NOP2/sun family putative RNA methylase, partial [candidate division WOR-3 bacterium]|nr:NOL1/NOP2/sun family putative RNA methylase [candidate division WOR-3 bacterium]
PPIVLNPKPDEKILDVAAAPGSKTTQIAQMMNNTGLIVANDISQKRLNALIFNIERMGVINTVVIRRTGQSLGHILANYFDKVLLDAPCSLEGIVASTPKTLDKWTESSIKRLSKIQKGLINSAFKCLKPNGILVYSTCTFAPEENEEVIDYLISSNANAICEPIIIANLKTRPALLEWRSKVFNDQVKNCVRIYPQDNNCEGFFVAKIRKAK